MLTLSRIVSCVKERHRVLLVESSGCCGMLSEGLLAINVLLVTVIGCTEQDWCQLWK